MTAGYSGTPLARKLSLKNGQRVWWEGMPDSVRAEVEGEGLALDLLPAPEAPIDAAHIFVTDHAGMEARLAALRPLLAPGGFIWVSWPKKASKVATDITRTGSATPSSPPPTWSTSRSAPSMRSGRASS